jgi:hypothetical protein
MTWSSFDFVFSAVTNILGHEIIKTILVAYLSDTSKFMAQNAGGYFLGLQVECRHTGSNHHPASGHQGRGAEGKSQGWRTEGPNPSQSVTRNSVTAGLG